MERLKELVAKQRGAINAREEREREREAICG